jgi:hypothetical protein
MVTLPGNQACGDFGKFPSMDNESFIPLSIVKEMMYSIKKDLKKAYSIEGPRTPV